METDKFTSELKESIFKVFDKYDPYTNEASLILHNIADEVKLCPLSGIKRRRKGVE